MFEQSLVESARHIPGARRTYSTLASLLLQGAALATLLVVPIVTTQVAPQLQRRLPVFVPQLESPAPPIESSGTSVGSSTLSSASPLRQPRSIQPLDFSKPDVDTPPASIHSAGSRNGDSALRSLFTGTGNQVAVRPQSGNKPPIVSVLEAGVVTSRVQPLYPRIAIDNRVQGTVHLHAVITPRGTLEELQVLSGPPVLANAAADAVRQWKFRPYLLNGNAIAVQTEIIVKFSLN